VSDTDVYEKYEVPCKNIQLRKLICIIINILINNNESNLAKLEEGSCNDNMTCTGGCRYSFMYS